MKRRDFLIRLVGAPIAAAVLPEALPAKEFALGIKRSGPLAFTMHFPPDPIIPWMCSGYLAPENAEALERCTTKLYERLDIERKLF